MDRPLADPFFTFRFRVDFTDSRLNGDASDGDVPLGQGAFSECTGLEATMEPKVIKAGGHNYGDYQRVGAVTFATVILKRGVTRSRDLWNWFAMATERYHYTYRLTVNVTLQNEVGDRIMGWELQRALPVKFKVADFNAKGTDIGIEELHLVHEGLYLQP